MIVIIASDKNIAVTNLQPVRFAGLLWLKVLFAGLL
jgi:hypothetical protein